MTVSCGHKKHAGTVPKATPGLKTKSTPPIQATEFGLASWYGVPYHGRAAANGEIYDMEKMTAAHRTLPFGTWVRVTNLSNGKTVDLRIIDRGPFIDGRIIDVSHAAAREIDLIGPGVTQVRVDIVREPVIAAASTFYAVQVASFTDRERAERMRVQLASRHGTARLVFRDGKPAAWRVLIGTERSMDDAALLAQMLQDEVGAGLVVRLDQ